MTKHAPPSGAPTPDCKKLFVGGLHLDTNEGERQAGARLVSACTSLYPAVSLANYLRPFGEVYAAEIMLTHSTHKSRGTRTSRGVRWSREGPRAGCPAYPLPTLLANPVQFGFVWFNDTDSAQRAILAGLHQVRGP